MTLHRITLSNTVFEGHNNAYLLDGEEPTLIDPGVATDETREQLEEGLEGRGYGFGDIAHVFLTHFHQDHAGLAGAIQDAGGAAVHVHPLDEPMVTKDPAARATLEDRYETYFEAWRMPEGMREELRPILDDHHLQTEVREVDPLEDGDVYGINGYEIEVLHAPGHAAGLCCFAIEGERGPEVFTGDAILPVYTPNVGGADVRVERPLERYIETLSRLAARGFERAWPGHRDPIDDPTARAEEIIHHHEERAWNVLAALRDLGPSDAWTVSAHLFGDLEHIHILHGPGEAYAHLDHLERAGDVERDGSDYRLVEATRERMAEMDDGDDAGAWPL